ncbi:MAG: tRNA glutamyl-Q(34) synthetase GluQRS [Proteobacteria bacterium]|nr:tRNA glutamyl-Q(34) synthetase GluQRS [Pseudomonadota bacterium]
MGKKLMTNSQYIGRFAPSPTGLLHIGSLIAAMASYSEAHKKKGQWLVRIEDIDPPREITGVSSGILQALNDLGFKFSQNVLYQSQHSRQLAYAQTLSNLRSLGHTYYCTCSRVELQTITIAQHKCRNQTTVPARPYSIKLKVPNQAISFIDKIQGQYQVNLQQDCDDFVLKRKDGLFSYQIAVVTDDAWQKVTEIVRGIDLIESTPWQIYLNSLLGYHQAHYAHIPILVNSQGQKLSKQTFAKAIDNHKPVEALLTAYNYLNQTSFVRQPTSVVQFWQFALDNWDINNVHKVKTICEQPI